MRIATLAVVLDIADNYPREVSDHVESTAA